MLLCVACGFIFSSCSKDEENKVSLTKEQVIGTWYAVSVEQDGESINVPEGYIYMRLNEDGSYRTKMINNSYIGKYRIEGNTIVGTTSDPITEYYKFASLDGNKAIIDYSNSDGDKYQFRVIKNNFQYYGRKH